MANDKLRGNRDLYRAQILQWTSFAESEILPASCAWVFPLLGLVPPNKNTTERAIRDVNAVFLYLNNHLLDNTFLVGDQITLADIIVFCNLLYLFQYVADKEFRAPYTSLNRWFLTMLHQPQVKAVVKDFKVCEVAVKFDAAAANKKKDVKKPAPQQQQPAKKAEKKEKEPEEELDAADLALANEPKSKDPFDLLPKGTFVIDEFKRSYSNEDESVSIPFFWEKFDPANYSIWYCEYKYNNELTKVFMSCNLIAGLYQRLDKMRKQSFASMCLFGEDNNSTISGVWFWRGQDLAFTLSPDWQIDYDCYEWKKLDAGSDETKALVKQYFSWAGADKGGRKFNQGKIFK